ncbi:unnamed protein product [Ceratitis capitata]|uniref:(Mediterranean fruit fly) hypothetical protein n=1 Tax=Ceratitis capitata TaxID=7213 RepID=A0A811V8U3_CERCA|nr:unnamed protein product [Ceratitis capitata]
MSIQDESFPNDELFDMVLSPAPLQRFQFPHRLRERQHQHKLCLAERSKSAITLIHNLSTSSSSADQTISSAESATEQQQPVDVTTTDDRMSKSDQTGISSSGETRPQLLERDRKSYSYQDIHSEYTKRRYKHVESKVGQYIANIRNEDERRRKMARFQRHRSLPVALVHDPQALKATQSQSDVSVVAEKLNRALVGVIDGVEEEEVEASTDLSVSNVTAATSGTVSTQNGSGATVDESCDGVEHRRETDESGVGIVDGGSIDINTYTMLLGERDRLQSYNDYQQLKLDEKQSEITRLRQNVDFLRVRLSTAEDQLKRTQSERQSFNGWTNGSMGYSQSSTTGMPYWGAGRQTQQVLLKKTSDSATQTELERCKSPPPPPPPSPTPLHIALPKEELQFYATPETPDANNNHCAADGTLEGYGRNMRCVAAIQPMSLNFGKYMAVNNAEGRLARDNATLRRRSNSLTIPQTRTQISNANGCEKSQQNSRTSQPSSTDSAIEVEVIELSSSPKPTHRKRYSMELNEFGTYLPKIRSLHYDHREQRTPSPSGIYIERCPNSTAIENSLAPEEQPVSKVPKKQRRVNGGKSASRRWLRLFGSCLRCSNPQQSESEQFALHQTYTQIPLLETTFDRSSMAIRSN